MLSLFKEQSLHWHHPCTKYLSYSELMINCHRKGLLGATKQWRALQQHELKQMLSPSFFTASACHTSHLSEQREGSHTACVTSQSILEWGHHMRPTCCKHSILAAGFLQKDRAWVFKKVEAGASSRNWNTSRCKQQSLISSEPANWISLRRTSWCRASACLVEEVLWRCSWRVLAVSVNTSSIWLFCHRATHWLQQLEASDAKEAAANFKGRQMFCQNPHTPSISPKRHH